MILEKTNKNFVSWVSFHMGPGPGLDEFLPYDTSMGGPLPPRINGEVAVPDWHYVWGTISYIQFIFHHNLIPPGS